jgi:hypothetical protein
MITIVLFRSLRVTQNQHNVKNVVKCVLPILIDDDAVMAIRPYSRKRTGEFIEVQHLGINFNIRGLIGRLTSAPETGTALLAKDSEITHTGKTADHSVSYGNPHQRDGITSERMPDRDLVSLR